MSDLMLYGVLRMPYEMAMADELSRRQFYGRVQEALSRMEAAEAALAPAPATNHSLLLAIARDPAFSSLHGTVQNRVEGAIAAGDGFAAPAQPDERITRYDYGYGNGMEGMFPRSDGAYVKWSDVRHSAGALWRENG